MQSYYYINNINSNTVNNNKYVYIDSINLDIKMKSNMWTVDVREFIYSNSFLPNNVFETDFVFPFCTIKNVQLVNTKQDVILNQDNLIEYDGSFTMDADVNHFLENEIKDLNLAITCNTYLDNNVLSSISIETGKENLEGFCDELNGETKQLSFPYFNSVAISSERNIPLISEVNVDTKSGYSFVSSSVFVKPYTQFKDEAVDKILNLSSEGQITINQISSTISFDVNEKPCSFTLVEDNCRTTNDGDLCFNEKIIFDENTFTFEKYKNGINGFYIPFASHGMIENKITLSDCNNDLLTINVEQNFSFSSCNSKIEMEDATYDNKNKSIEEVYHD